MTVKITIHEHHKVIEITQNTMGNAIADLEKWQERAKPIQIKES